MADATNIKNLIVNTGSGTYQLAAGDIYAELGISQERFAELLARDFYCPVLQNEPTASTLTYVDTDGSVNHFAIGQECRVPDVESQDYRVYKFMGTYQGNAVWQKLPEKLSDLVNDAGFYSGANVQVVDADEELDEPNVTYLTTVSQALSEEEKETVKANLGISVDDIDLSAYATKDDLASYATKEDISQFITDESLSEYATKGELTDLVAKEELEDYATKQDISQFITDESLSGLATKEELNDLATKEDLAGYATKEELNIKSASAYQIVEHGTSDTSFTLTSNVFHVWEEVESLDLSFADEIAGVANEYMFQFTSGSLATTLTLPEDIKWASGQSPVIEENKIYQISILNGLGSVLSFDNLSIIDNFITISGKNLIFDYPTASELTIEVTARTGSGSSSMPSSQTVVVPQNTTSYATGFTTILYINSVEPNPDSKYNYIYYIS